MTPRRVGPLRRAGGSSATFIAVGAIATILAATGCGDSPRARPPSLPASVAAALADSLRVAMAARFELPVTARYGAFTDPANGDSISGYVVRISVPYEMVAKDSIPHEWLRTRFAAQGWALEREADGADGSSYSARRGPDAITVEATWEDTQPPAEVLDWYAVTVGITSRPLPR